MPLTGIAMTPDALRPSFISASLVAVGLLLVALSLPAQAQSVNPVPESGVAAAGTASTPIANVAANDTVNGAPAVLGLSGNATVAELGTWPSGISLDPNLGAISTTASVPPGVYSLPYQLCDLNSPPDCGSAIDTVTITGVIIATPESGSVPAGSASTAIANVAANDTVNGSAAVLGASGNATIMELGTWPSGISLDPNLGAISTTASVPPGVYSLPYQLCDLNTPPDCASAIDTVTVGASIIAISEAGTVSAGSASTAIANVTANDTVNGAVVILGASGNATVTQLGTWPAGILLDPNLGAISTTASVPPAVYSLQYQLCDLSAPPDCASAIDTVTVTALIVAAPGSGSVTAGTTGIPIANVAANDTVNGTAAVLGPSGNATVTPLGTWPLGIALDPNLGAISTTASVPPGVYSLQYQLCDLNAPPDCASATDTVTVTALIVAAPESGSVPAGTVGTPIANVAANDVVNGALAILGPSGNATVAQLGAWPSGILLNATSGAVSTNSSIAPGVYSLQYQLCDLNAPPDCASATDTVTVVVSIVATSDTGTADAGIASRAITSVAANDTVNGSPATLGSSGNATIAEAGTWPAGITLNTASGAVSTTAALAPGIYNIQYQLCNKSSPPVCSTTTDAISVISPVIAPISESGSALANHASIALTNVTSNDTVDGSPAALGGTSKNATIAPVGTWAGGITLNKSTGAVSIGSTTSAGIYSIQYELCDLNVPPDCANTTDTITVNNPSIVPVARSGTADAGIASQPIANVAANNTVNGAAAKLGSSGNATIAMAGSWPTGISLSATTGVISTSAALPAGVYKVQYQLCDKLSPPDCATATDTVTVISAAIVAMPQVGSAIAGTASVAISNVAGNGTVDGAPALLGASGNATIAQVGTWSSGITLNKSTGAVSTTGTTPPGTYNIQYELCDLNVPPDCTVATDMVTVMASVVANPVAGSAISGIAFTPVANVAAGDKVNGAAAKLGASGNATVAMIGTWPTGIALNTATGAISTTAAVGAGSNQLQYQLCDTALPITCSSATATITVAADFAEVQATSTIIGDMHFDWARDGVYCASCNFNEGNARFTWSDTSGHLWVGHLNPATGAFTPPSANNELADTSAFYFTEFGNGADFAFSTQNGQVMSQIVYTRYTPGQSAVPSNAGVAFATQSQSGWAAAFLPEAMGAVGSLPPMNTVLYQQSQCNSDPTAVTLFYDFATPTQVFWEPVTNAPGTSPTLTPFGAYATFISGDKPGARWVPCTHQLVFAGAAPPNASGNIYQQVFWYDTDTQVVQQLSVDPNQHLEAFLFQAPEFNDAYVLITISNGLAITIYQQTGSQANGAPTFQLINQITSPDPAEPYIYEIEPFINCTPTCQTYLFMKLQATAQTSTNTATVANGLAVTNINPAQPMFKILVPAGATPTIQRMNPKYFITAKGPYLYYSRNTISSSSTQFKSMGRWYIDMQLGIPSGTCVGSSGESGMMPGC
jgi:hypothetical protein